MFRFSTRVPIFGLALALVFCGCGASKTVEPVEIIVTDLEPAAINTIARKDLLIIDVREPEELSGELGKLEGSLNIPLDALLENGLQGVPLEKPILLLCRSGQRSTLAANILAASGYRHVYNLKGGMLGLRSANL